MSVKFLFSERQRNNTIAGNKDQFSHKKEKNVTYIACSLLLKSTIYIPENIDGLVRFVYILLRR